MSRNDRQRAAIPYRRKGALRGYAFGEPGTVLRIERCKVVVL
jgi:hypothetical protein